MIKRKRFVPKATGMGNRDIKIHGVGREQNRQALKTYVKLSQNIFIKGKRKHRDKKNSQT